MVPPSSRSVDPRLASAAGVVRDTIGGMRNLQHLLGSVRVGPKALARAIPAVHASCKPLSTATRTLVESVQSRPVPLPSIGSLGDLIARQATEIEQFLGVARKGALRAAERLQLEASVGSTVKTLEGALELVELVVEATAPGSVPVDVWDVVRESGAREGTASSRDRRVRLVFQSASMRGVAILANPRLAVRLISFATAFASGREPSVEVTAVPDGAACRLEFRASSTATEGILVALPPLIDLSERCVGDVAHISRIGLQFTARGAPVVASFPLAPSD